MGRLAVTAGEPPRVSLGGRGHTEDDYAQIPRLNRFREEHPDVIIGGGGLRPWQALVPHQDGETVRGGFTLRELLDKLDKLDELLPPDSG